jgi:imidazolonepropionase-like amidohydrolase
MPRGRPFFGEPEASLVIAVVLGYASVFAAAPQHAPSAPALVRPVGQQPVAEALELRNGRWFDGTRFEERTVYIVNGRFELARPISIDRVVDLTGGYALPPFGEAHNHNFSGPWDVEALVKRYLHAGVFYVQNPANVPEYRDAIASALNSPQSVDVTFANGAITGPRGHPMGLYEEILRPGYYAKKEGVLPRGWFEGKSYHIVSTAADLDAVWPRLLRSKPDFIKIILEHSEDYERNLADPSPTIRRGLSPTLARTVVERAHRERLRVVAHTGTASDFRTALDAGVDQVAHLPGYNIPSTADEQRYTLTALDAAKAARNGVVVTPTASLNASQQRDANSVAFVRRFQTTNLRLLKDAGVKIAVGTDNIDDVSTGEFQYLASLDVFTTAELLRLWSEVTPQAIFPKRRVGRISPGYEASFIVLARNPLEDPKATGEIIRRFKQGVEIERTGLP